MDEIPKNFKLIDVIGQGDCAIDAILEGMKRHYNNDKIIIDKMNEYLDEESKIKNIVLLKNPFIKHSEETIRAFRKVLFNYYGTILYEKDPKLSQKTLNKDDDEIRFLIERMKKIKNLGEWLENYDLNYISQIFNICIKLWFKPETKYVWGYIKPSFKINDPTEIISPNGFDKCKTIIYIRHNGSHYDLLLKDAGNKKPNGINAILSRKSNVGNRKSNSNNSRKSNSNLNDFRKSKSRTRKLNTNTLGEKDQDSSLYNIGIGAILFVIIIAFSY